MAPSNMAENYITKASPGKGLGVFATSPIKAGTVVMRDKTIMKLDRPAMDITNTQAINAFDALSPDDQVAFMQLHETELPYVTQILRIYKSNCFGDEFHSWLYLRFSRINHSCLPNAELTETDDELEAKIVALKAIAEGEEVTISYLSPLDEGPKAQRQELLGLTYGFECGCVACSLSGEQGELSDMRRHLINVLAHRQLGYEPTALHLLEHVNGLDTTAGAATLGRSRRPVPRHFSARQKVVHNFLLARLMEAEGLVNYQLAQAWVKAAVSLMAQMQEAKPFVVIPAAKYLIKWLDRSVEVMRSVRLEQSVDVKELEKACTVLHGNSYVKAAKRVMDWDRKGVVFATVFGKEERKLTQKQCIAELRKMRSSRS